MKLRSARALHMSRSQFIDGSIRAHLNESRAFDGYAQIIKLEEMIDLLNEEASRLESDNAQLEVKNS